MCRLHGALRILAPIGGTLAAAMLCACSGNGNGAGNYPSDFQEKSVSEKMEYVMKEATPDSVARFICNVAIDRVPGVKIDSLTEATLYAYEHYTGKDLVAFQEAYDDFTDNLPLSDKMKLYFRASLEGDPIQMGYQLGLEYPAQIRDKKKSVADVEKEIAEFKRACGKDTDTYNRFIQGFKIALQEDHGKDLPEDIYRRFVNY